MDLCRELGVWGLRELEERIDEDELAYWRVYLRHRPTVHESLWFQHAQLVTTIMKRLGANVDPSKLVPEYGFGQT